MTIFKQLILILTLLVGSNCYAKEFKLDIESQPLNTALNAFAKQSGLQVVFSAEIGKGFETSALKGLYTPQEAIARLLANTPFEYNFLNERTIAISSKADAATQPSAQSELKAGVTGTLRLAQTETPAAVSRETSDEDSKLQEVVVTGSHIRGGSTAGSKVITIDREEIRRSGHATVQDVVQSLPQNFGGGANEDSRRGQEGGSNFSGQGSTINLRGAGSGSTLVLVNGRRQSGSGDQGAFFDVSTIPLSAVERIEVLTDGASAIYGSDAVGGVVNIILMKDYNGAETQVRYAPSLGSDVHDVQASQVFGKSWESGSALLTYEYYERSVLASRDRDFTNNADLRSLGGDDFRSPFTSNPGNILDFSYLPVFAIPRGQDGRSLTTGDFVPGTVNLGNVNAFSDQLPSQKHHAAYFNLTQKITPRLELFAEGRFGRRHYMSDSGSNNYIAFVPDTNAFFVDPASTGTAVVAYDLRQELGSIVLDGTVKIAHGAFGANLDLGSGWRLSAYGAIGQERTTQRQLNGLNYAALSDALASSDPNTALNIFGDGVNASPTVLQGLTETDALGYESKLREINAVVDGSVFELPGGSARLALGADGRKESIQATGLVSAAPRERKVGALFSELSLPFVNRKNARPGLERLEISAAARYEDYNDFGTTLNPKLGVAWSPLESLTVRGSWGTSFKAPKLGDLDTSQNFVLFQSLTDSTAPGGSTVGLLRYGNNSDLKEETAHTWTLGLDYDRAGFKAGLTYYAIRYEDRITRPAVFGTVLQEADRYSSVIVRNPTQAQIDAVCNSGDLLYFDASLCNVSSISVLVDERLKNSAVTEIRGLDLLSSYSWHTSMGLLSAGINGAYMLEWSEAFSSEAPVVDMVDTVFNPLRLHLRGNLDWNRENVGAGLYVNYAGAYKDDISLPSRDIGAWTTVDLQLRYMGAKSTFLQGFSVALSAINVFDRDPPFVNNSGGVGYDQTNADPRGRVVSLQLTKTW